MLETQKYKKTTVIEKKVFNVEPNEWKVTQDKQSFLKHDYFLTKVVKMSKFFDRGDAATWPIVINPFFKCLQRNEFRQTNAFFESLHKRDLKKYLYR